MRAARLVIRLAAWLVPAESRHDWRCEWLAELAAARPTGHGAFRFALGAPRHAWALWSRPWQPALLGADIRLAVRSLRRQPGFTLAAGGTLALGVGATVAMFSVAYAVLFKPLPYRDPGQLVQLWETNPLFHWTEAEVAPGNAISWRERNVVFSDLAWYEAGADRHAGQAHVTLDGTPPERITTLQVSANFFGVLGIPAAFGRTFAPGEDTLGRDHEVILSDRFWRSWLGARPDVVGGPLQLNGETWTVVGIMPASFTFDQPETDLWIPAAFDPAIARELRRPHLLRAVARLKPGITVARAQQNLSTIARDLEREFPDTNRQMGVGVGPLDDWLVGPSRQPLLLFLGGVGLVLVLACANVTNLLVARSADRVRQMSIQTALGASRLRLARQAITESFTLAAIGTGAGTLLAVAAIRLFVAQAPGLLPRSNEIGVHPVILLFAAGLMIVVTVTVGAVPVLQGTSDDLRSILHEGGRGASAKAGLSRALVAVEVAFAVALLMGAAMTARSFRALATTDLGFPVDGLVSTQIALPAARYATNPTATRYGEFYEALVARLRQAPGVDGAGATFGLPVVGGFWTGDLFVEDQASVHGRDLRHRSVTSGYLETLGLRLIAGRTIRADDRADRPLVVVINQTLMRMYFNGANPVGRRLAFDQPSATVRWRTIVGVTSDEPQAMDQPVAPMVYDSESQEEMANLTVVVRSRVPLPTVVQELRTAVAALDPQLPLAATDTVNQHLRDLLAPQRLAVILSTAFGAIALLLAAVGVYGVVACAVAVRTREIGIRVACGATARDVMRLFIRQHLRVVWVGLLAGGLAAYLASGLTQDVLYGVHGRDAGSLAVAVLVLVVVAVAACAMPAARVLRVDPVKALRAD
jgi:putative ABC transport system permease protein